MCANCDSFDSNTVHNTYTNFAGFDSYTYASCDSLYSYTYASFDSYTYASCDGLYSYTYASFDSFDNCTNASCDSLDSNS